MKKLFHILLIFSVLLGVSTMGLASACVIKKDGTIVVTSDIKIDSVQAEAVASSEEGLSSGSPDVITWAVTGNHINYNTNASKPKQTIIFTVASVEYFKSYLRNSKNDKNNTPNYSHLIKAKRLLLNTRSDC